MVDAISTALAGLNVQKLRVSTAAQNVANVSTGNPLFSGGGAESSAVYKPLTVQITAQENGGPVGTVVPREGETEVDLATEAVTLLDAKTAFKANLAVIKVQDEMTSDLLDTLA